MRSSGRYGKVMSGLGPNHGSEKRLTEGSPATSWDAPETLNVCVVGSGAIGGLIGGRLAGAGADVILVDQGAHLDALAETGLTLIQPDGNRVTVNDITTTTAPVDGVVPDLVVLGTKAYDLPTVAPLVADLTGSETVVLPVQNGIPWWYFHGFGGELDGRRIRTVDPDGTIQGHIDSEKILGCVPFVAGTVPEPGTVRHTEGEWFPVGELDGTETARAAGVAELFEAVGLRSRVLEDVRSEIWLKELGNLAFNPISALTRATLGGICREPKTRAIARTMMEEAKPVAEELGATFRRSIDERINGAEAVGDHKTSMLQDLEAGNRLETEALVGAVVELARLTDQSVPTIETVYGLTTLLETTQHES
jgi:ketopantoate reductase